MEINGQEAAETSETQQQLADWQSAKRTGQPLPAGAAPLEPEEEPVREEQVATTEGEVGEAGGESWTIGDQTFTDQGAAWKYAQQLQLEKNLTEARLQGLEEGMQGYQSSAQPQQLVPEVAPEPEFDEERYYADPQNYLREREAQLATRIEQRITSQATNQQKEQQLWNDFTNAHPDLDGFQSDAQAVLNDPEHNKRITLLSRTKGQKAAMDYLAMQTRDKFERYIAARKPKRELANSRTLTPSSNNAGPAGGGVTQAGKSGGAMDFSAQLRTMRGKR